MESKQRFDANDFRVDTEADFFQSHVKRLYTPLCPSVRPLVGPSVGPSVRPSVRPSIRPSVGPSVTLYFFGGCAVFGLLPLPK